MNKRTILLIEDDQALAEAIEKKLEHAGFDVAVAFSAESAIAWEKTHVPDFVWLDMLLPGMSGLEYLEHLRKDERLKNIPVLMVSVSTGPEKVKRAFELNIIDFVSKADHDIKDVVGQVTGYFATRGEGEIKHGGE